jgi:plasmid stability protein/dienelactone hydrolase
MMRCGQRRGPLLLLAAVLAAMGLATMGAAAGGAPAAPAARTNQQGADFRPPASRREWEHRRAALRRQILFACGLLPMPEKTPLHARVFGRTERDGYTLEKVVLETFPGFYLSGNLYRPAGRNARPGRLPGILNPHGHWAEGRVAGDVQARCIAQARMGAVAFLYDMVGYVDSRPFGHAFMDDELFHLGFNLVGLQLWNSIRALDWLLTLPDVDAERVACTGESGGGTQTFLLGAVDDRVGVSAPVCMVSHHFQGGCSCENAPGLRLGTDNVEIAACFAPRPQLLVGATGDWTSQIMERGVPELRAVYALHGAEDRFEAVVHQADHNYNRESRESVYRFLRRHLWGQANPRQEEEAPYTPETEAGLSTWSAEQPRPAGAVEPAELRRYLAGVAERQAATLRPRAASRWRDARQELRDALAAALAVPEAAPAPEAAVRPGAVETELPEGYRGGRLMVKPRSGGHPVAATWLEPAAGEYSAVTVVCAAAGPRAVPGATLRRLAAARHALLLVEPFMAGATAEAVAEYQAPPFFAVYNRTVLAERVCGLVTAVRYAQGRAPGRAVNLLALGATGPAAVLALPFCTGLRAAAADLHGWEWPAALPRTHEMALPGARRLGGMRAWLALAAGPALLLHNSGGVETDGLLAAARLQRRPRPRVERAAVPPEEAASFLVAGR